MFEKIEIWWKERGRIKNAQEKYRQTELGKVGSYYSTLAYDYYSCIFIHIPKTAGISVTQALFGNYADGHTTIKNYKKKFLPQTVEKYFKFTFVRNPYDRLYSAYNFLKKGGMNAEDKQWADSNISEYNDFEDFVFNWLTKENAYGRTHFVP